MTEAHKTQETGRPTPTPLAVSYYFPVNVAPPQGLPNASFDGVSTYTHDGFNWPPAQGLTKSGPYG
jgi:hypothetical protein